MSQRCREEFLSLLGECFGESAEEYATNDLAEGGRDVN
jgi:hypothetical protein